MGQVFRLMRKYIDVTHEFPNVVLYLADDQQGRYKVVAEVLHSGEKRRQEVIFVQYTEGHGWSVPPL